jgi:hypothetical protein
VSGPKVFLSYAHVEADKKFVSALYNRLKRDGVECFFDEASLAPGANFVLAISQAIDQCNYLVMVMSQAYFSAGFAPTEWTAVFAADPKNERGRLLPLLREYCYLPPLVKPLNYVDVSSDEKFEENYFRIWWQVGYSQPNDIEQRSQEIDDLFLQDKLDQAFKRLLDFAREFSIRDVINRIIAIIATFHSIYKDNDITSKSNAIYNLIKNALDLRDSIIDARAATAAP